MRFSDRRSHVVFSVATLAVAFAGSFGAILWQDRNTKHETELSSMAENELNPQVRRVFENRCVVCHSCYTAPCQLNLTSYEGFARGATKALLYNPSRLTSVPPTRIYTDARTPEEWRQKGFNAVAHFGAAGDAKNLDESIMYQLISQRQKNPAAVNVPAPESNTCPANPREAQEFLAKRPESGMPYGLPALDAGEFATLQDWLQKGSPGPVDETDVRRFFGGTQLASIREWEQFFNGTDLKTRLVSRYLYDHFFLAHMTIEPLKGQFFRLVRSRTECSAGVDEIATVRPYDNPGIPNFSYCFRRLPGTPTDKSHVVYQLSRAKMDRLRQLFYQNDWQATSFPSWDSPERANPFVVYQEIPGRSRYQFLLDDAQYHIMTFTKGPVCRGNSAVNSIQEQFGVFFLDPKADPYSNNAEFRVRAAQTNQVPAQLGSDINPATDLVALLKTGIFRKRNDYRRYRSEFLAKQRPEGYGLQDIWDGDGRNDNAVLTVLRHFDSATVMKGLVGDVPKTVFVLDYVLFERLSYDLVSGFSVFGDLGHQIYTRLYMAGIRMEAEHLFLNFMPPEVRKPMLDEWYQGSFTQTMYLLFPLYRRNQATQMRYQSAANAKKEFFEQVLGSRLNRTVRGGLDPINWTLASPAPERDPRLEPVESELRKVTSRSVKDGASYVLQLPDLAFLRVRRDGDGSNDLMYSIVRHKEHANIAWISAEQSRRDPRQDSISIVRGVAGSFPNRFFVAREADVPAFVRDLQEVRDENGRRSFNQRYGVARDNPEFWRHSDWFTWKALRAGGVQGGLHDLSRYEIPESEKE